MHFQIYIPGASSGGAQPLEAAGLSDLVDGALSIRINEGPDGEAGLLYGWQAPGSPLHLDYNKHHTWIPAVAMGVRPAGRYWVGIDPNNPPSPAELQRSATFAGVAMTLGRFEWQVPCADNLPAVVTRRDDGRCQLQFLDFDEFLTTCRFLQLQIRKLQPGDGIDYTTLVDFVETAFRCNYRYVPEIGSQLQWWTAGEQGTLVKALFKILPSRDLAEVTHA